VHQHAADPLLPLTADVLPLGKKGAVKVVGTLPTIPAINYRCSATGGEEATMGDRARCSTIPAINDRYPETVNESGSPGLTQLEAGPFLSSNYR
jgi:hypothetical protein